MTRLLLHILTPVLLTALPTFAQHNDWLIVPGTRVGPIKLNTTRPELDHLFGKANVRDEPVDSGEGPEPATRIFPSIASQALSIFWNHDHIANIMICYPATTRVCKWHTNDGITFGTTAQQLESLNGRPFQFEPWGTDVSGNITDWQFGKLGRRLAQGANNKLWLTLNFPESLTGPSTAERQWIDEGSAPKVTSLSSNDEAIRHLKLTVARMILVLGNPQ